MQISFPVYKNSFVAPQMRFGSSEREVFDSSGNIVNRNYTTFFRTDLKWENFVKFLENKYQNQDKINLTCYGCSDGSEAYTLALSLMSYTPETGYKIYPIIAKDNDTYIIKKAKSERCDIAKDDILAINDHTEGKMNHYFNVYGTWSEDFDYSIAPKKPLYNKITFEQANILNDLENLPNKNNVIMCRNFWNYLGQENFDKLAEMLYEKTKDKGLVIIGSYDRKHKVNEVLERHNFRETSIRNVFEPINTIACGFNPSYYKNGGQ